MYHPWKFHFFLMTGLFNCMLLQICNGALEPCFCGFCMQLHFCNSFISLKKHH